MEKVNQDTFGCAAILICWGLNSPVSEARTPWELPLQPRLYYRLEALSGDGRGQYSVRINQQWRICFEWPQDADGAQNVEIVDYH